MVYQIELEAEGGVFAWLDENPGSKAQKRITAHYRKAHKQAFREFMTGASRARGNPGIARRFSEAYGSEIAARTTQYVNRVERFYGGRYLPFTSPTPSGSAKNGHLRDLIKEEGAGFRTSSKNNTDVVTTIMTMPAARVLNFYPKYASQFLELSGFNSADGLWIEKRAHEIAWPNIEREIKNAKRRVLRGQKA